MSYTAIQLITNAYAASGIVSRDFQTVSATQITDGLDTLNEILTEKTIDLSMRPYYQVYNFNAVIGQEEYFIDGLIEIETLVFFINGVRFSMTKAKRKQYFGTPRADNVESLPGQWHIEREVGGARLFLYFKPSQPFDMQLWGQFGLDEAAINTNLATVYDKYYISYLKYQLADRLCINFNYETPMGVAKQLAKYELMIDKRTSPLDLSMKKISTMSHRDSLNYGIVNLSGGWIA